MTGTFGIWKQKNRYGKACEHLSEPRRPRPSAWDQPRGSRSPDLDTSGGFLGRCAPSSPTTGYPCGLSRPSPAPLCVWRREPEGPEEAPPSLRRRAGPARQLLGSPPPVPSPRGDTAAGQRVDFCEHRSRRSHPGREEAPECHEELPGHGTPPHPSHVLATATTACTQPDTQSAGRRQAAPTPRPCRGHPAPVPVARLGAPLCPRTCTAVIRRRRATRSAAHFPTMRARAPANKCQHHQPCPLAPPPCAPPPLAHLVEPHVGRGLQLSPPRGCHRGARRTENRVRGLHAQHATTQPRRHRCPIPQPPGLAWLGPPGPARPPKPLTTAHTRDAGRRPGALLLEGCQVPVQMALRLGCARGHLDHLPHVTRTLRVPPPLAHGHPIAFGAPPPPVDLHGGGIHDMGRAPVPLQKPLPPEACAPRCRATDHGGRCRQPQAAFRLGAFVASALGMTCGHGARARLWPLARGAAELPGLFTQCTGHKPRGCGCVPRRIVGRCGGPGLSPPGCNG